LIGGKKHSLNVVSALKQGLDINNVLFRDTLIPKEKVSYSIKQINLTPEQTIWNIIYNFAFLINKKK
jgi:hypothetical protein